MKKIKLALFLLTLFLLTICLSFIVSAEETIQPTKSHAEAEFDKFKIGESYKTVGDGKLHRTEFSFTVDHNGNIYLICVAKGLSRQLMVYAPSGEYLYSVWLPKEKYNLLTDEEKNHIYIVCTAYKMVYEFDDNGTLLDITHETDSKSKFYQTPIFPKVSPFGEFRKEQTSKNVTIFLRNNGEETVYFQKDFDRLSSDIMASIVLVLIFVIPLLLLLDGVIYKIRTKGKITDAFFFRCIKRLYKKIDEAKYPQKQDY